MANENLLDLNEQTVKIIKISDQISRTESTLARTKKHINFFKQSFCNDKVAMFLVTMIVLTTAALIYTIIMPAADE